MSIPLLKRNMMTGLKLMLAFIAILAMYGGVIIWMYDPELSVTLEQYKDLMPEIMAAAGMNGESGTLIAHIHTYLYGFIFLVVPMIYSIMLVNRLIMRYVDNGSLANLLATPNSRKKVILTQLVSIVCLLFILFAVSVGIGFVFCETMFPGELELHTYLILNVATFLLHFAISGIGVAAACFFNETKWYLTIGAGVPLIFYLVQMLANMGEELEKLKYASLFTLLPSDKIIAGESGTLQYLLILAFLGIVLYVAGLLRFIKKDFSV